MSELTPAAFIEAATALAHSGKTIPLEKFQRRTWRKALPDADSDDLDCAVEDGEDEFEEVLEAASVRKVQMDYDDMLGTTISFHLFSSSPDSGVVLTIYTPDESEVTAKAVSGDLSQGFEEVCREWVMRGFRGTTWDRADASFLSGVTLVNDEEYPIEDEAFWKKLLAPE